MQKQSTLWEIVGYLGLAGTVIGQIIVGYWYLLAQGIFLVCNCCYTIRSFAIGQMPADKVKNITFTAIAIALIIIKLIGG